MITVGAKNEILLKEAGALKKKRMKEKWEGGGQNPSARKWKKITWTVEQNSSSRPGYFKQEGPLLAINSDVKYHWDIRKLTPCFWTSISFIIHKRKMKDREVKEFFQVHKASRCQG